MEKTPKMCLKGHGAFKIHKHGAGFLPVFKAYQWNLIKLFLMAIDTTKKTGKKTSRVVNFIVSMTRPSNYWEHYDLFNFCLK
jgi:hypothetical protein